MGGVLTDEPTYLESVSPGEHFKYVYMATLSSCVPNKAKKGAIDLKLDMHIHIT